MGIIVVSAPSLFIPSRMNKNGTATVSTSFAAVSGWTADTGTYPGSSVSGGNALVVQQAGSGTITVSATWNIGIGTTVFSVNITVNGVVMATASSGTAASGTTGTTYSGSFALSDLIRLEAKSTNASFTANLTAGFVQVI